MAHLSVSHNTVQGGFWADIDDDEPQIHRMRDRIFVGAATETNHNRITGGVQTDWGSYPNWAPRDSQFIVMADNGTLAITGMSRTSDKAGISPTPSTWGIGGLVVNDAASAFARAAYFETQRESGAGGSPGIEVVVKNKGDSRNTNPYSGDGSGSDGMWLVAGGDPAYGGTPAEPANTAITVKPGAGGVTDPYKFNKGIVFDKDSLVGTDGAQGDTGTGVAIQMARRQQIQWLKPDANVGAFISSTAQTGQTGSGLRFENTQAVLTDGVGLTNFAAINSSNAVNYVAVQSSAAGTAIEIQAAGTDNNIPIRLLPKGTSGIRYKWDVFLSAAGASLSAASSGRLMTNTGASARSDFTLPAAAEGLRYGFYVSDADGIRVIAGTGDVIQVAASTSAAAGRVDNATIGSMIWLVAIDATVWAAESTVGTWTVT
jgi:hypothetical protein